MAASDELARAAPPEGVARVSEFRRRSRAFVRGCLAEAHRRGMFAPGLGPDEAAVLVLGSLLALARGASPTDQLRDRVWAALERALRGGQRHAGGASRSGRQARTPSASSGRGSVDSS